LRTKALGIIEAMIEEENELALPRPLSNNPNEQPFAKLP
jgi:hypothetical protein